MRRRRNGLGGANLASPGFESRPVWRNGSQSSEAQDRMRETSAPPYPRHTARRGLPRETVRFYDDDHVCAREKSPNEPLLFP